MKKLTCLLVILTLILLPSEISAPYASALQPLPQQISAPTSLEAAPLAAEQFTYRTLLTFMIDYDILNVLGTQQSDYGIMNLSAVMRVQFRVDGGEWQPCIFPDGEYTKALSVGRPQSVSVLNLNNELQRGQLADEYCYIDPVSPVGSHLDVFAHSFSFRVQTELKWLYSDDYEEGLLVSPWSAPAKLSADLTAETLPETLNTPQISLAEPVDTGSGAGVGVAERTPLQLKLLNRFTEANGGLLSLDAQISVSNLEWRDIEPDGGYRVNSDSVRFLLPAGEGLDSVASVLRSNVRIRFRYRAVAAEKEIVSEWSEPLSIGTYQPDAENPDFESPAFLRGRLWGIPYQLIAACVLILAVGAVIALTLIKKRGRKRV